MSFIENMTAESINMETEEFESYVSGKAVPPGSWRTSLLMCEGLQQMSQNLKCLSDLKTRHDHLLKEAVKLQEEMNAFQVDVESEVSAVLERTKYNLNRQKKQPINPDAELEFDAKENLPPPLTPQGASSPIKTSKDDSTVGNFLEDYLSMSSACTSDNVSLLSLDTSGSATKQPLIDISSSSMHDVQEPTSLPPETLLPSYRGFTAQSNQIMSISCDNSASVSTQGEATTSESQDDSTTQKNDSFSTPSSSPLVSAATSLSTPEELVDDAVVSDDKL